MPGADRDSFDSRIDAALRSYAEPTAFAADPRTAAAAILERARESQRRRRRWWFWAAPAVALLAAMVIVVVLRLHTPALPRPMVNMAEVPRPAQPLVPGHTATTARLRPPIQPARRVLHRPHAAPLPEQAVFPTPAPLSRQEEALLVFIRTAPPAVRKAVIAEQSRWAPADPATASPMHPVSQLENEEP